MSSMTSNLPLQLRGNIDSSLSMARAAARREDHVLALVRLSFAEAYARSRMLYFASRKGCTALEFEALREVKMIAEEVGRAREYLTNGARDSERVMLTASGEYCLPPLPERTLEERGQPMPESLLALRRGNGLR